MSIIFCTTCKNRAEHLKITLPKNLEDNPNSRFVVLDYGDSPRLSEVFAPLIRKYPNRLFIYRFEADKFHMAHAKNMAARLAIRKGADIIVTLDADNYTGNRFEDFIKSSMQEKGVFLVPLVIGQGANSIRIQPRGVAGRIVIRSQDFIKIGGYDEKYDTWHGEDVDIAARLRRMGMHPRPIAKRFLHCITHQAGLRFLEYPHAQELYENDAVVSRINNEKHTVVNFGKIGCGLVTTHGFTISLRPVPTRIFGIGYQRTGTQSLDEAFEILGFDSFHFDSFGTVKQIYDEIVKLGRSVTMERFYALSDTPIPLFYKELDKAYPGSKFILTVRNEQTWLKSVAWLFSKDNPERWTWDKWPINHVIHLAMYRRKDFNKESMLIAYRRHNAEVIEYFKNRPNDLLVMKTEKPSWVLLTKFLGVGTIPNVPYPWKGRVSQPRAPWWKRLFVWITGRGR